MMAIMKVTREHNRRRLTTVFLVLLYLVQGKATECKANTKLVDSIKYLLDKVDDQPCHCQEKEQKVAFVANLEKHMENVPNHSKLPFTNIITNVGGALDDTGTFVSPRDGTYYFSWTLYTNPGGICPTEIVVNGISKGIANHTFGNKHSSVHEPSTQTAVLVLKKNDKVWIRMERQGQGYCYGTTWTTFSGFAIW